MAGKEFVAKHASLQAAIGDGHRAAGAERNIAKGPAILGQREFGLGAAIQIVED